MGRSVLLYNSSTILTMPLLRPYAAFSSFTRRAAPRSIRQSAAARPIPQHVRDLLRATVMEREIRREKPPKIKDHQTARSTMLNIQDQHRPVKARELELDLPRAVAHQRKLRHSQEDQEARRQRKLDPAQQAARLERAEVRAARVKALKRRAKMERHPKSPTMMFLARAIPRRSRRKLSNTIRNSSKAMTELLQLQRIRLTRSSGRVKEGLLITSRNTL